MEKECVCNIPNNWYNHSSCCKCYKTNVSQQDCCCCCSSREPQAYPITPCPPFWQPSATPNCYCIPVCRQPICQCPRKKIKEDCHVKDSCDCRCTKKDRSRKYSELEFELDRDNGCTCCSCPKKHSNGKQKVNCSSYSDPQLARLHRNLLEQMKENDQQDDIVNCCCPAKPIPKCCTPCLCAEPIGFNVALRITREQGNSFGYYTSKKRALNIKPAVYKKCEPYQCPNKISEQQMGSENL